MSQLRSDVWCAAFIRRHNDLGHMCVVSRKGHLVAGQIWIEVDHLDGTMSLFSPAPLAALDEERAERVFDRRFTSVEPHKCKERIAQELDFDPDIWVITLEMRSNDIGVPLIKNQ